MNIKTKLKLGTGIAVVVAGLVGIVLFATFNRVHAMVRQFRQMDGIVKSVFELKIITIDDQQAELARARDQWQSKYETLLRDLNTLNTRTGEQRTIRQRMLSDLTALRGTVEVLRELPGSAGGTGDDDMVTATRRRLTVKLDSSLLNLMAESYQLRGTTYAALVAWQQIATAIVTLSVLAMMALIAGMGGMVIRTAIRPLLWLGQATEIIGAGDLDHRTGMTAENEVGKLSRSFDAMLDRLNTVMASRDALDCEVRQREMAEEHLKKSLEELERSNRELEEFAYVASHDLQEPLRKISAFSSLLVQECSPSVSADGREYLDHILGAVKRMQLLISDLLQLSRISTRARTFSPVDLNATLREVLEDLDSRLRDSGGTVAVETLPVLDADATQMRQLFQNLVANALKFRKPGEAPAVRVRLLESDDQNNRVVLGVDDNGIGFEPRFAERIFGLFQRLHGRLEYEGTGIGLAVCRRIVERHKGHITAEGRPGDGASFRIELPLRQLNLKEGVET